MGILDPIVAAARGITPPQDGDDPRAWRLNVFWSLLIIGLLLFAHLAAAYGLLERFGVSGVASAAQVQTLEKGNKAILYAIYAPQFRAKIRERCDATTHVERERINVELDRMKAVYKEAAGEEFSPMPTCDQV